jgi:hypothetical protein
MATKDLRSLLELNTAFNVGTIGSSTTTNGNIIDLQGNESATFDIFSGAITDGTYLPNIQEGDDSALGDATSVTADYLVGTYADATFVAADDQTHKTIGYVGKKRYIRLQLISSGVTTGGMFGAGAILGDPKRAPIPWNG